MATHSSILAWRIPWTEEPGGLQSTRSQRVGHDGAASQISYKLRRAAASSWEVEAFQAEGHGNEQDMNMKKRCKREEDKETLCKRKDTYIVRNFVYYTHGEKFCKSSKS